jgi:leucyl-tRNA synthetase
MRGEAVVPVGITEPDLVQLAKGLPKVAPFLGDKPIKRAIYIKGKLINLLV